MSKYKLVLRKRYWQEETFYHNTEIIKNQTKTYPQLILNAIMSNKDIPSALGEEGGDIHLKKQP